MKTILLRTGWDTLNIGDIGHTPGTLRVFEDNLPDMRVIAWMHRIDDAVEAMLRRRFPNVPIIRGELDENADPDTPELAEALDAADVVIHNTSMSTDTRMMQAARKRGKRYGMFGQSYFPADAENPVLIDLLRDAAFVFCRETLTLQTLRDAAGVGGERSGASGGPVLAFNPDGCFGIDVRDDTAAEAYLAANGLEPGQFITIHLRTNTQKRPGLDSPLNPANPTPRQRADDERRAATLRAVITGWVEQTGKKVLIAPEVYKEIPHNRRLLLEPLPESVRAHVVQRDRFWNVDEAASVFARAAVVVCHEPHSCIIAMANGTPVLHTYSPFHSPKYHMFADIGVPGWLLPIDELPAEALLERLLGIYADLDASREKVTLAMHGVHARLAKACATIRRAAENA